MRKIYPFILVTPVFYALTLTPTVSRADMFGGDVAVLIQILTQATQEVLLLEQAVQVAKGDADFLRKVNRDIEIALQEIKTAREIVRGTTEIGKAKDPREALQRLLDVYGKLPTVAEFKDIETNDRVASQGFGVDEDTHQHARTVDRAADQYEQQARSASPGRAQQLTAQSQATTLRSLAQIERGQATQVRVSSAHLALENQREKNRIESIKQSYNGITQ